MQKKRVNESKYEVEGEKEKGYEKGRIIKRRNERKRRRRRKMKN